ncbi:MAG TPA: hypothetical protein VE908_01545 [Mycobacterium sp.]|nr:hypothetical protein [Mycobacterium sp.]
MSLPYSVRREPGTRSIARPIAIHTTARPARTIAEVEFPELDQARAVFADAFPRAVVL